MDDAIGSVVFGVIFFAVAVAFIFIVGLVVVPIAVVGGGTLWYVHNVHLPEKRRKETNARLDRLYAEAQRFAPSKEKMRQALATAGITDERLLKIANALYEQEGLAPPAPPPATADQITAAKYQEEVQTFIKAARGDRFKGFLRHLTDALSHLQPDDAPDDYLFVSEREVSRKEVDRLLLIWPNDEGHFKTLIKALNENYWAEDEKLPSDCKHSDYAWRYLKGTPLLDLRYVAERVALRDRMYHTYLLGSSGSGKTNLIENIIAHDLESDDEACIVVIDSQTQLTEKLARLDIENKAYFTPQYNLALNLFDVGYDNLKRQGIEGETLINKTVGLLSFVMEGMMGTAFTNPQRTIFQYAIQLVISIKGGNIFTFMEILSEGGLEPYQREIAKLDENTQRFFAMDFPSDEYKRTREAIRRRLDSLLLNPTFRRLFSARVNKIDMAAELNNRKLILIDTNKPMLDADASAFFGRLFIAMILRASHQRFGQGRWMRPVYLIVDEAHEYFDRSIADMLEQARKANIGLIVAHQSISQAKGQGSSNIADPLMVNTATKIIWTTYREDAAKFAGSMQVSPDEILKLPQFTFGMHSRKQGFVPIRGTPNAFEGFATLPDTETLQWLMEDEYGPSPDDDADDVYQPEPDPKPESDVDGVKPEVAEEAQPSPANNSLALGSEPTKRERKNRPPPPDMDMI